MHPAADTPVVPAPDSAPSSTLAPKWWTPELPHDRFCDCSPSSAHGWLCVSGDCHFPKIPAGAPWVGWGLPAGCGHEEKRIWGGPAGLGLSVTLFRGVGLKSSAHPPHAPFPASPAILSAWFTRISLFPPFLSSHPVSVLLYPALSIFHPSFLLSLSLCCSLLSASSWRSSWASRARIWTLPSPPLLGMFLPLCQKDRDSAGSSMSFLLKPALRVIASSFVKRVQLSDTP